MYILGTSAFYHDSAACLLKDGKFICNTRREIFKKKMTANFLKSYKFFLENYKLSLNDIDYVVFYEKPFIKFERLIETYVKNSPRGFKSFVNQYLW